MTTFAQRCGIHDERREQALRQTARLIDACGLELVRFAWCDLHGMTRGKTLSPLPRRGRCTKALEWSAP